MSSVNEQSNGFLPLAALSHADPTAVGLWDLDSTTAAEVPSQEAPSQEVSGPPSQEVSGPPAQEVSGPPSQEAIGPAGDQLVLARLHQQPVALLHLPELGVGDDREALIDAVWRDARGAIIEHISAYGCLPIPTNAHELRNVLELYPARCPGRLPDRPAGQAAVIVCSVGRGDALARTLRSLAQMPCEDYAVVVVDNRPSQPQTRATVERFASTMPVRYVTEPRPGLAIARNTGVAAASDAAYVAFTDDDVVVDPHWLPWLLAPFVDAEVSAVTGLVMPLSLSSNVEKRFEQYAGFGKGLQGRLYDLTEHRAADRFLYPYWGGMFGSGNSMAFRREVLLEAGGFDPALGAGTPTAGGEDLAAFTDVILAGGRLVYEPRSLCWHEHRADEQALRTQVHNYGIGLTAVLWRYFRRDSRFTMTLLRSLPLIAQLALNRASDRQVERLPADLARLELRGRLLGPWRYFLSARRNGTSLRSGAYERRRPAPGRRRSDLDHDQTRT